MRGVGINPTLCRYYPKYQADVFFSVETLVREHTSSPHFQNNQLFQKRIVLAFVAYGAAGSVATYKTDFISQRQQLFLDGKDKGFVIPTRKIRSPYRAIEENIAHMRKPGIFVVEDHMTGGMAGTMEYPEQMARNIHLVALFEPVVRRGIFEGAGNPEHLRLFLYAGQQFEVILVWSDYFYTKQFFQGLGPTCMINMTMSEKDLVDRDARLADRLHDAIHIAAWIDYNTVLGFIIPQKRTVLLEWRHIDDGGCKISHDKRFRSEISLPVPNTKTGG